MHDLRRFPGYHAGIVAFFAALVGFGLLVAGSGTTGTDRYLPHGVCYAWSPRLMRLHLLSDALIGLAYVAIPIALVTFIRRRRDVPFNWMFVLFGVFIVACGATHWMEVWTLWNPNYWISGWVKAITAAASVPTALLLFFLLPKAVALPSIAQLEAAKRALEDEVARRGRAEAALEESHRLLERRVQERTSALSAANDQLEAQREALERASREKTEFLAVLSHELRNPVHAIRLNAWVIRDMREPAAVANAALAIERQIARLAVLLQDLLDVVQVSRRERLQLAPLDLGAVVAACCETARSRFDERRQALRLDLPPAPLLVQADRARLEQALDNLLDNANKYTRDGGNVWISTSDDGQRRCVRVRDDGTGIAADDLPRIFELFGRGASAAGHADGLGVGLHIAREIAHAHGGTVTARSAGLQHGAEFELCLPVPAYALPGAPDPPPLPPATATRLRVLVVEDNVDAADTLALALRAAGHEVAVRYEGHAAVAHAAQWRPHLALVDIGLPTISGFDVALSLGASGERPYLVAVTGWGTEMDKQKALDAGFDEHLTKPVDVATLLSAVARATKWLRDEG